MYGVCLRLCALYENRAKFCYCHDGTRHSLRTCVVCFLNTYTQRRVMIENSNRTAIDEQCYCYEPEMVIIPLRNCYCNTWCWPIKFRMAFPFGMIVCLGKDKERIGNLFCHFSSAKIWLNWRTNSRFGLCCGSVQPLAEPIHAPHVYLYVCGERESETSLFHRIVKVTSIAGNFSRCVRAFWAHSVTRERQSADKQPCMSEHWACVCVCDNMLHFHIKYALSRIDWHD